MNACKISNKDLVLPCLYIAEKHHTMTFLLYLEVGMDLVQGPRVVVRSGRAKWDHFCGKTLLIPACNPPCHSTEILHEASFNGRCTGQAEPPAAALSRVSQGSAVNAKCSSNIKEMVIGTFNIKGSGVRYSKYRDVSA